jgi:hypothetical protein
MYRILRNTFLTSRTGLKVTMTVPIDPEEDGADLAVERDTPETYLFVFFVFMRMIFALAINI